MVTLAIADHKGGADKTATDPCVGRLPGPGPRTARAASGLRPASEPDRGLRCQ